jgi:hypothetical protein
VSWRLISASSTKRAAKPWVDTDAVKVAGFYDVPLTILVSGRLRLFESSAAILAMTQEAIANWHAQPGGTDVATQLSAPGTQRCAVVHIRWGAWWISLPDGKMVQAPECTYVLGKSDAEWRIVMMSVDWKAVPSAA